MRGQLSLKDYERYKDENEKEVIVNICGGESLELPHGQNILTPDGDKAMFIGTSAGEKSEIILWYFENGSDHITSWSRKNKRPLDEEILHICGFEKLPLGV